MVNNLIVAQPFHSETFLKKPTLIQTNFIILNYVGVFFFKKHFLGSYWIDVAESGGVLQLRHAGPQQQTQGGEHSDGVCAFIAEICQHQVQIC